MYESIKCCVDDKYWVLFPRRKAAKQPRDLPAVFVVVYLKRSRLEVIGFRLKLGQSSKDFRGRRILNNDTELRNCDNNTADASGL